MTESSIARDNERLRVEREWSGAELRVLRKQVGKEEQTELSSVGRALDCRSKGRWFNSGSSDFSFLRSPSAHIIPALTVAIVCCAR